MSTILRFKRGTTSELASLTESLGEVVVDTSKKTLVVMDGVTAGGTPLATTAIASQSTAGLMSASDKTKLDGLSGTGTYTLPTASTTTLGGVKVDGTSITISNGVISAVGGGTDSQTLTFSGTNLSISGGNTVNLSGLLSGYATQSYVTSQISAIPATPQATVSTLGTVKVDGTTIVIAGDGTISAVGGGTGGGATTLGGLTDVDTSTAAPTDGQALVYDAAGSKWIPGTVAGGTGGDADTLGGVPAADYLNKRATGMEQVAANVQFQKSVRFEAPLNGGTQLDTRYQGAQPGTRRYLEDGVTIDETTNYGTQANFSFYRYGKTPEGLIDTSTQYQVAWFGMANWTEGLIMSGTWAEPDATSGNRKNTTLFHHKDDGRLLLRARSTELRIGTRWDGVTSDADGDDNGFVFANNAGGMRYITAGGNLAYKGDGRGLYGIPSEGINNSTKRFVEPNQYNTYSGEQVFQASRSITTLGRIEGKNRNNGGEIDGQNLIKYMLLNQGFNGLTFSNLQYNDLGFGRRSGRVANFTVTSTTGTVSFSDAQIDNLFDAAGSYVGIPKATAFPTATDDVVMEFQMTPHLRWEGIIGVQFIGGFHPTYCKIEAYNNKDDGAGSPIGWEIVAEDNMNGSTDYVMGRLGTADPGLSSVRITIRKEEGTTDVRIVSIFGLEYNSAMGQTLFVDRSGGNIYGDLNVNGNLTINGSTVTAGAGGGGGAVTINDLTDVDTFTAAPTDGQALVWDNTNAKWIPGTVSGGGSVDLTNYLNVNQSTTITADQTMDGTLIMNGALIGPSTKTRKSQLARMIIQSSIEAGMAYSPNFINDWAYGYRRGLIDVSVTDRDGLGINASNSAIDSLFDAKFSYFGIPASKFVNGNQVTIELQLSGVARASYGGEVGIQFSSGGGGFGPDYVKIEAYKADQAAWVVLAEDSNMAYGNFLVGSLTQDGTGNGPNNITGIRFTFSKNSTIPDVSANDIRINTLWCVDASTQLGTSLFATADSAKFTGRTDFDNSRIYITAHQHDALSADGVTKQGDLHGQVDDASVAFQVYGKDAVTGITDTSTQSTRGFIGLKNYTEDFFIDVPRNTTSDGTPAYGTQKFIRAIPSSNIVQFYAGGDDVEQFRLGNGTIEARNGARFIGDGSGLTNLPSGATTINELTDVDTFTIAPTDGQALVWDNTNAKWIPGTVSGGGSVDLTPYARLDGSTFTGTLRASGNFVLDNQVYIDSQKFRDVIWESPTINRRVNPSTFVSGSGGNLAHNVAAFYHTRYPVIQELRTGTTWGADSEVHTELFANKTNTTQYIIDNNDIVNGVNAARWTLQGGFSWSGVADMLIAFQYSPDVVDVNVIVETSADSGVTWTERHNSSATGVNAGHIREFGIGYIGGDSWMRITIESTGVLYLGAIRLMSGRPDGPGMGAEVEIPYNWDADRNINFLGDVDVAGNFTVNGQPVSGGAGGSATNLKRIVTVSANGNTGTVSIIANGSQADLNAVTVVTNATGSVVTIGNVAAGLMLTSVTFHQSAGFNTTTGWTLEYPEVGGATTLIETSFPTGLHYNAAGVVQAANLWTISNNAGIVSAAKSNLSASTEYYLTVKIV